MNTAQTEIKELLVKIFTELDDKTLDKKSTIHSIKSQFNVLSSEDSVWSDIEDKVLEIIELLKQIH